MPVSIRSIRIKNFRSISDLSVDLSRTAIFVGSNDAGKSNILRALNLFFNYETNPATEFDFEDDFNFNTARSKGRAPEISITVEIDLPSSYHRTNGQVISWTKSWREDGLWSSELDYHGIRISQNTRGRTVREKVEISAKSNVRSLLSKIEFEYVPAVKSNEYFDDLRGRIYGIISDIAAKDFHKSSTRFEKSIGDHVQTLTEDIGKSLGIETRLALPRDLYHIFENLDFLGGKNAVSLNNRGDGIKARHIPLILKFMAEKKAELLKRGGAPVNCIWAYEEPENNLELASAVRLSDELYNIAKANTAQVILTTHSPAFYDLALNKDDVSLHYVKKISETDGTSIHKDTKSLDDDLGTLAVLRQRIPDLISKVRTDEAVRLQAAELAEKNKANIFVEGESDKIVVERCIDVFFPDARNKVSVTTKSSGGGDNYVFDMLRAWRSHHKHHTTEPLAAGIVDGDAREQLKALNKTPNITQSAKCFNYPKHPQIVPAYQKKFEVPETLETLYPIEIWKYALDHEMLTPRKISEIITSKLNEDLIQGKITVSDYQNEDWWIFVESDFDRFKKISAATYISRKDDAFFHSNMDTMRQLLTDVLKYLGLEPEPSATRNPIAP